MNGCSNSIGSPEPRCIGARSVMLPDTKVIPAVPQECRLWFGPVMVSTITVNGIRAAIKQR